MESFSRYILITNWQEMDIGYFDLILTVDCNENVRDTSPCTFPVSEYEWSNYNISIVFLVK